MKQRVLRDGPWRRSRMRGFLCADDQRRCRAVIKKRLQELQETTD
jgi:hypothetical protein